MEQGMKANQQQQQQVQSNGHHSLPASPTSAALVSRVEKQRMVSKCYVYIFILSVLITNFQKLYPQL